MKKRIWPVLLSLLLCLCVTACGKEEPVNVELKERERYDNRFTEATIPDQWTEYGIGDPFVMRYDGKYYLYVSTKNFEYGYRVWRSTDMIHYEYLGQHQLLNADGTTTGQHTAYAPEVYYWNGDFYMYCSPDGKGHYIYKSEDGTPYGDFRAVTGNLGLSIDGSVFIDDNEKMYFYSAADGAINSYTMDSMTSIDPNSVKPLHAPLQKWTEGPCVIKRDGRYYMTYTGNHVKSTGYRVDYSVASDSPVSNAYVHPANNSLLLSTLTEQNGLGHSSTVLGPDLDSYYISYHNLQSASGPIRQYNLNRLEFAGDRMNVVGPTDKGAMVPNMPDFYVDANGASYAEGRADALVETDGKFVSNGKTGSAFTAEYNFSGIEADGSVKLTFGDGKGHVTVNGKTIELYLDGAKAGSGSLINDFDWDALHTVRIACGQGRITVAFDNMTKIDVKAAGSFAGAVGYAGIGEGTVGATAFSNYSFGTSDNAEAKIAPGRFMASNYLLDDGASRFTKGAGVSVLEPDVNDDRAIYSGAEALLLNKGDYCVYGIDVGADGLYGLEALLSRESDKSVIRVQIDDGEPMEFVLSKNDYDDNYGTYEQELKFEKQMLGEFRLTKGLHTLKVSVAKGRLDVVEYNLFRSSEQAPQFTDDLSAVVEQGADYFTLWKVKDDAHYTKSGVNSMVMFGADTMTDYTVSVKLKLGVESGNAASAGIIVRMNNPSFMTGQVPECAQGYLITLNNMQMVMTRIDYGGIVVASESRDFQKDVWYELKAECRGNKITVYLDGEQVFSYVDPYPFSHGAVALYSISTESYYRDLSIRP